ncbi:MAG TPA: hypothetical protein VKR58_06745 [Aquella sp.]|nr:hypothetical protein [Aquella sp.]
MKTKLLLISALISFSIFAIPCPKFPGSDKSWEDKNIESPFQTAYRLTEKKISGHDLNSDSAGPVEVICSYRKGHFSNVNPDLQEKYDQLPKSITLEKTFVNTIANQDKSQE